jgi:hypothetical protein
LLVAETFSAESTNKAYALNEPVEPRKRLKEKVPFVSVFTLRVITLPSGRTMVIRILARRPGDRIPSMTTVSPL